MPACCSPFRGCLWLLLAVVLLPVPEASGIIIRHDRADSRYVVAEADWPQVFSLHRRLGNRVCVATLIAERWAITAAHCLEDTPILETLSRHEPWPLTIAGVVHAVEALVLHPEWVPGRPEEGVDLALLRLDRPVRNVTPVPLYRGDDEYDQTVSFLGWGFTGWGTVGRRGNDGKLRRAQNRVSEAGQRLHFRFDDPRRPEDRALPLEGVAGLGDSGGPALVETPAGLRLMGVALGEILNADDADGRQGLYGAVGLYERISIHLQWIESYIVEEVPASPVSDDT